MDFPDVADARWRRTHIFDTQTTQRIDLSFAGQLLFWSKEGERGDDHKHCINLYTAEDGHLVVAEIHEPRWVDPPNGDPPSPASILTYRRREVGSLYSPIVLVVDIVVQALHHFHIALEGMREPWPYNWLVHRLLTLFEERHAVDAPAIEITPPTAH